MAIFSAPSYMDMALIFPHTWIYLSCILIHSLSLINLATSLSLPIILPHTCPSLKCILMQSSCTQWTRLHPHSFPLQFLIWPSLSLPFTWLPLITHPHKTLINYNPHPPPIQSHGPLMALSCTWPFPHGCHPPQHHYTVLFPPFSNLLEICRQSPTSERNRVPQRLDKREKWMNVLTPRRVGNVTGFCFFVTWRSDTLQSRHS